MPIYEYLCPKCGQFEVTQRITEDALKRCPTCRGKVQKLISASSFQLKGTGWYLTDYARSENAKPRGEATAKAGDSAAPSSSSESSGKTENKAAA